MDDRRRRDFTDDQILATDIEAFLERWDGRYREAIDVYYGAAERQKARRARRLSDRHRRAFDRLDRALEALDDGVVRFSYRLSSGGTAAKASCYFVLCRRLRCLWRLAGEWPHLAAPNPAGERALRRQRQRLDQSLARGLRAGLVPERGLIPGEVRRDWRRALESRHAFERFVPQIPEGAAGEVARWVEALTANLDHWIVSNAPK